MTNLIESIHRENSQEEQYHQRKVDYLNKYRMALSAVNRELNLPEDSLVRAYVTDCYFGLSVTGTPAELKELFRAFRKLGYEPSKRPGIKPESSFSCEFNREGGPEFYLCFASKLCRRVQVGTKTVEQPIYETVCE